MGESGIGGTFAKIIWAGKANDSLILRQLNVPERDQILSNLPPLAGVEGGSRGSECGKNATGSKLEFASNLSRTLILAQLEC
jgi:hypothetical protein